MTQSTKRLTVLASRRGFIGDAGSAGVLALADFIQETGGGGGVGQPGIEARRNRLTE